MRGYTRLNLLLLACAISFFLLQPAARAAKVVDFYDFLSSVALGVSANHTITFVTPSGVSSPTGNIDLFFGTSTNNYHFSLSAITLSDVSLAIDNDGNCDGPYAYKTIAAVAAANTWGLSIDSANYRIAFEPPTNAVAGEIPAGGCVQVMIGDNVAGGANQIVNPNISDGIHLDISGAFGDFGTMAVLIFNDNKVNITAEVNDSSFSTTSPTSTPPTVSAGGWSVTFTDNMPPEISNFKIDNIGTSQARISWTANELVNCSLKYGKSYFYEIGNSIQSTYATSCSFNLSNLAPGTNYLFRAVSADKSGNQTVTDSNFSTKTNVKTPDIPEIYFVENVSNFNIIPSEKDLLLVWERPKVISSRNIMILRSEKFFPTSRQNGDLLYSGLEPAEKNGKRSFLDKKSLIPGRYYYYNIVSLDQAGHESSGALNFAILNEAVLNSDFNRPTVKPPRASTTPTRPNLPLPDSQPTATSTDSTNPLPKPLSIDDFKFIKNDGIILNPQDGRITITESDSLLITIKRDLLSTTTRRLIANLIDSQGGSMTNFRHKADDNTYYANFSRLRAGEHQLVIGAYDDKNELTQVAKGFVNIQLGDLVESGAMPIEKTSSSGRWLTDYRSLYLGIFLILLALILILAKKKFVKKM